MTSIHHQPLHAEALIQQVADPIHCIHQASVLERIANQISDLFDAIKELFARMWGSVTSVFSIPALDPERVEPLNKPLIIEDIKTEEMPAVRSPFQTVAITVAAFSLALFVLVGYLVNETQTPSSVMVHSLDPCRPCQVMRSLTVDSANTSSLFTVMQTARQEVPHSTSEGFSRYASYWVTAGMSVVANALSKWNKTPSEKQPDLQISFPSPQRDKKNKESSHSPHQNRNPASPKKTFKTPLPAKKVHSTPTPPKGQGKVTTSSTTHQWSPNRFAILQMKLPSALKKRASPAKNT